MKIARHSTFALAIVCASCMFLAALTARAAEIPPETRIYDTGKSLAMGPNMVNASIELGLSERAGAGHEKWTQVPEDKTDHAFKGDIVLMNEKMLLLVSRQRSAARIYAITPTGAVQRATITPLNAAAGRSAFKSAKIAENNTGVVSVNVTYQATPRPMVINYELKVGQPAVQIQPRDEATGIRLATQPCRFVVLPDFFADDMVIDATAIKSNNAELPADNFLMHMVKDSIVMAVWDKSQDDIAVTLAGKSGDRAVTGSLIEFGKDEKGPGKIYIALLEGKNIWHTRDIAATEGDKEIRLDWNAPFIAQWRVDWQTTDKITDTWEMLTQKPDGTYEKHGWYGQAENFGNDNWLKAGRERWTTVLGRFKYPCWIDKGGEGYIRPLVNKALTLQGPIVIYPINRINTTPIEAFTAIDIMRATLGVGPCEYILDVSGQKKNYTGLPTCETRTALNAIYAGKEQVKKHDEVVKLINDVHGFVRQIRGRIEDYREFGRQMNAYLESQKKAYPQYADQIGDLLKINRGIEEHYDLKKNMKAPEYATGLVNDFRAKLIDYEGPDALDQCKKIMQALVYVGADQDELVGECRVQVKILRQRAALAMANDPKFAPIAKEVRKRTQQMLRNPLSYEAPRH
ncbi:hypothetical protein LLG95_09530 [bacterium]|nr:hypothetical protein [bacterium]